MRALPIRRFLRNESGATAVEYGLLAGLIAVALIGAAVVGAITRYRLWGVLWRDWFTSVDHKKIGIMYIVLSLIMLLRGFSDALMMRAQQAIAFGSNHGYLPPEHYDQIFTAHVRAVSGAAPYRPARRPRPHTARCIRQGCARRHSPSCRPAGCRLPFPERAARRWHWP